MNTLHSVALVGVMAAVTAAIRFAPFLIFRGGKETPAVIRRLGTLLPGAVMAMLVVYCLRNAELTAPPHALPEVLAVAVTAGLHLWKRSTLLSIIGGTVCYMLLVQLVFV
ncbi:MAG: AzlD domain-containing protein [Oscillospiraceae bacterium]|nr:AzlD domain-containing protein [Oscillospiraceae bacterium]